MSFYVSYCQWLPFFFSNRYGGYVESHLGPLCFWIQKRTFKMDLVYKMDMEKHRDDFFFVWIVSLKKKDCPVLSVESWAFFLFFCFFVC